MTIKPVFIEGALTKAQYDALELSRPLCDGPIGATTAAKRGHDEAASRCFDEPDRPAGRHLPAACCWPEGLHRPQRRTHLRGAEGRERRPEGRVPVGNNRKRCRYPENGRRRIPAGNKRRRRSMTTLATHRRLALFLRDASTVAARYTVAHDHADECRAGWPAQTIGASPDTSRSSTAGGNGIPHDPADRAARQMNMLLNEITGPLEQLARLVDQWTPERWHTHQHVSATDQLAEIDGGLWCPNHLRHGHHETRDTANRRRLCRWCYGIERDTKLLPDRDLIEHRARMGRTTSKDIDQFRQRNPKKRKKGAA